MRLFLIDGHALVFKMYYAFLGRPMVNSKGVDTSILFGFTKYLLELIGRESPTHLAVSFDPPGGTFRNVLYPEYKANRGETPRLVIDALDPLTAIVRSLGIPVLMIPGFEADDVIGSVAVRCASEGMDVYMVTPDKDYGQLVSPRIFQYKPGKSGADSEVLGEREICEKWGIDRCRQVIDILAICGDASDNVPGVPGVGPVGASGLLRKYGSVEGIYGHLDELTPRQQAMFRAAEDHMSLSRELVTIKTDLAVDTKTEDMRLSLALTPEADALFNEFEFPSLRRLLAKMSPAAAAGRPSPGASEREIRGIEVNPVPASDLKGGRVAMHFADGILYVSDGRGVACGEPAEFRAVLEDGAVTKTGISMKTQMRALALCGIEVRGRLEDAGILHYLLNPESSHKLEDMVSSVLGAELCAADGEASLFSDVSADRSREAAALIPLADALLEALDGCDKRLRELYDGMEEPLIKVLFRMEEAGVKVDLGTLDSFAGTLRSKAAAREAQIREIAGDPNLNVNSPKQIGELLFEKLAIDPKAKKPCKGSWPTDEKTLSELSGRSPVIGAILDYRGLRKLLGTYIEPFSSWVSPLDGRVHTTFNQALTSTGRLSSSNPNLQNIPIRTEQGREIRKAFVAEDASSVIMSADYSQIELRIMAHLSGDAHLCEAFREGTDIHSATASRIFGVPVSEVTSEQRRIAKTANFGIMYGISAFGLAQNLACSRSEAQKLIDDYFDSFPSIRAWIDETLSGARERGYVQTLFGRRRYVPDVVSGNAAVRAFAERNAVNAPIQGTSADIIKLAMVSVDRRLRESSLKARMVLQIHDELLLEVPRGETDAVRELLVEEMQGVAALNVPLTVECNYGSNWLEAH